MSTAVVTLLSDSFASAPARRRAATRRRFDIASDGDQHGLAAGLVDTLAAQYPVVRRMVGDDSFRVAVHRFAAEHLPTRPHDNETFPRFLRRLGRDASFEYLADIAELELAFAKARHAPPVQVVAAPAVAWSTERLDRARFTLHPSVGLIASRFPIVTIWEANRSDESEGMIGHWKAEAALSRGRCSMSGSGGCQRTAATPLSAPCRTVARSPKRLQPPRPAGPPSTLRPILRCWKKPALSSVSREPPERDHVPFRIDDPNRRRTSC